MSYDVWLEVDTGGAEPAQVGESWNQTSNVAPMWRAAGADLAEFHGMLAADCVPQLQAAITNMVEQPDKYTPMNPPNGWGSYDTCLGFLRGLLAEFVKHPKATVHIWR
jgi:hypothetical protein